MLRALLRARVVRVAPCCPARATHHVTTCSYAKMHVPGSVSCRDVAVQVEFGLDRLMASFLAADISTIFQLQFVL